MTKRLKMISLKEAEKNIVRDHIKELEKRTWEDVARARRSIAIIEIFIKELRTKSMPHFYNKDAPMINALSSAAIDSVIISLGRLLNPNSDHAESTLIRYKNSVIDYLNKYGPVMNESRFAKESLNKLKDKKFIKMLKKRQKQYQDEVMPWRDKVAAHNEINAKIKFPKNLIEIIEFIEEVHKICYSAMEDSGGPGLYSIDYFKKVSDDWINCLLSRQNL